MPCHGIVRAGKQRNLRPWVHSSCAAGLLVPGLFFEKAFSTSETFVSGNAASWKNNKQHRSRTRGQTKQAILFDGALLQEKTHISHCTLSLEKTWNHTIFLKESGYPSSKRLQEMMKSQKRVILMMAIKRVTLPLPMPLVALHEP